MQIYFLACTNNKTWIWSCFFAYYFSLLFKVLSALRCVLRPVFEHFDLNQKWLPPATFAVTTFKAILCSIQTQNSSFVIQVCQISFYEICIMCYLFFMGGGRINYYASVIL